MELKKMENKSCFFELSEASEQDDQQKDHYWFAFFRNKPIFFMFNPLRTY